MKHTRVVTLPSVGRINDALHRLARLDSTPQVATHSTLAELIINDELQRISLSRSRALAVAAIYRARQMNADTLGSLPLRPVGDDAGVVPAPNARQSTREFVIETVLSMQDKGDAYWRIQPNGDLDVLWPTDMRVTWNADRTRREYRYRTDALLRPEGIGRNLVVLSLNRSADDLTGAGPMESGRISGLIAEQAYSQEYFENNGNPTGILAATREITADEAKLLKESWVAARAIRQPAVLGAGLTWDPSSFSPNDSQWVETHMVGIGDIATLFAIPGVLLNYNQPGASLTYQAIDDVYEGYWRAGLFPNFGTAIEQAWAEATDTLARFDPEALFLASLKERAEAAGVLVRAGYDPADTVNVVGLPAIRHTAPLPVTIQQEKNQSDSQLPS